ncbi:LytR/AlgR family response regulator transcription factor [Dyella acidisoli]|uniref:DNA-binding response regulator n=1 Tax=Dyella acidisoli TaxID=1867834 RepID=A0ABQ5XT64_9GAMM|nr:LytTR family DNA-binding domain-containing protein [Dyella acidisoli]GLQ94897.1 DNA-binding response regulator [Dyella acidisoli]
MTIRGLIAEDEAPQREDLCTKLRAYWPELQLVAACENGSEALEAVSQCRPQVAFLDIRMPGASGLDVACAVAETGGLVVFTTAYDEYAIQAFEAGAIDYLLKPIQDTRLQQSVARLRQRLAEPAGDLVARLQQLSQNLEMTRSTQIRWITASVGDSVRMFDIDEVIYFQAHEKYVRVMTGSGEVAIRTPLKELIAGLDPDTFWQVQRGIVVRVSAIERLRKNELGKFELVLKQRKEVLPVGSSYAQRFRGM